MKKPDKPRARNTDPQTSHDAAEAAEKITAILDGAIIRAVTEAEPRGMTVDELTDATRFQKVSVSPRLRPLCRAGFLIENGKRPGLSGRTQTVWVLAKKDKQ